MSSTQRKIGYRRAMTAAGLADRIRVTEVRPIGGRASTALAALAGSARSPRGGLLLERPDRGAAPRHGFRAKGLRVPDDLAVMGYDNSSVAALPQISLSSIDQSGIDLGTTAAEVLLERITGRRDPRHILLDPHLVRRSSVG